MHLDYRHGKSHATSANREGTYFILHRSGKTWYSTWIDQSLKNPRFKAYKISRRTANYEPTGLRLSPYHPELDPAETSWALAKTLRHKEKGDLQAKGAEKKKRCCEIKSRQLEHKSGRLGAGV